MISVVCVYNDKEILKKYLLKSLKNQSVEYELILIDNTEAKFKSAAEALNKGGEKARGNYLLFVHQDIDLLSDEWLENCELILNSLENFAIAGVAGRSKEVPTTLTNIFDGIPPEPAGTQIKIPTKVLTLDECLVLIPTQIFKKIKFDEEVCDNWHLYTVDYSLVAKKNGYDVYVIPLHLYHRSSGFSFSDDYYITLKKLLKKHRNLKIILTTMGDWVTFIPLNIQIKHPGLKKYFIYWFEFNFNNYFKS
jgi:glycosyltransferase involved in cell wall biosynthesis